MDSLSWATLPDLSGSWRRALLGADAAELAEYGQAIPGWLTELPGARP